MIVEEQGPMIYEAIQPVSRTPLAQWAARAADDQIQIYRLDDAESRWTAEKQAELKAAATARLGRPYDIYFRWDEERLYCSELVYKLYQEVLGVEVGRLRRIDDFNLDNGVVQKKMRERYGQELPLSMKVVSPADQAADEGGDRVATGQVVSGRVVGHLGHR